MGASSREGVSAAFARVTVLMRPLLDSPLGRWLGNPMSGYIALLVTTGRRSGLRRSTPLSYGLLDGSVYLLAGFGYRTDWLANIRSDPRVEVVLPGRRLAGTARVVTDPEESARAARAVLAGSGFAPLFEGLDPRSLGDLRSYAARRTVVRVETTPPARPGSFDPGGRAWLVPLVLTGAAVAGLAGRRGRRGRRGQ